MLLRPVRDSAKDAEAVRSVAAAAFGVPRAARPSGPDEAAAPGAEEWPSHQAVRHRSRTRHFARTDPEGCWLAEDPATGPLGAVLSVRREGLWGLSLLAVVPAAQGKGLGTALLERALAYGRGCLRGIICSSSHPAAARCYRRAGFDLHPAMRLGGAVDPARLAAPDGPVHDATARHRDLMDSVDRRIRGGAHGPDHEEMLRHYRGLVADDLAGSGYCYLVDGKVELLAATSRRLASRLLTAALLCVPAGEQADIRNLTADQQWALDVGFAAGLQPAAGGYLALRGMRPPAPYIPSGAHL